LTHNEKQAVGCLFRDVLIYVERNIFRERHVLIFSDQVICTAG
jgi:hypothetical protein